MSNERRWDAHLNMPRMPAKQPSKSPQNRRFAAFCVRWPSEAVAKEAVRIDGLGGLSYDTWRRWFSGVALLLDLSFFRRSSVLRSNKTSRVRDPLVTTPTIFRTHPRQRSHGPRKTIGATQLERSSLPASLLASCFLAVCGSPDRFLPRHLALTFH